MALARGLSTIQTKRYKTKITKARLQELEVEWRKHNKTMKQKGLHDLRYEQFTDYLDYCFGKVKIKTEFKKYVPETSWRRDDHREKYPSAPLTASDGRGTMKERMKYTGTLVKGIATMHKSNAVPVINEQEATDIARMRRG